MLPLVGFGGGLFVPPLGHVEGWGAVLPVCVKQMELGLIFFLS